MFETILIANRGEIACRIIKTAKSMGIKTIAIYSDVDENARFVRLADDAYPLDGVDAQITYLNIEKIIEIAKKSGAQAIHPGYGFLSENPIFAKTCAENGIVFIGASPDAIEAMGLKDSAKQIAISANVPVLPGYMGDNQEVEHLKNEAQKIGFPLLIKAIAGGGGRGIRQVDDIDGFEKALESAMREAKSAFNDDRVMLEKLVLKPRHIEVQVFGDTHGNVVHLFERDCSVQRRRQKLIEEAPAPNLPQDVRTAMFDAACKLAKQVNYQGAGTIEFIVDGNGIPKLDGFWFLEMNTRLQVEHPVTELITNLDLVEWQIRVANGEKLPLSQAEIKCEGHAIEARIVAEDPNNNFMPSSGRFYRGDIDNIGVRVDYGFEQGDIIPSNYDSLIEKVICWGYSRESTIDELKSRLMGANYRGFANNGGFVKRILDLEDFENANLYTAIIDENIEALKRKAIDEIEIIGLAAMANFHHAGLDNVSFKNFGNFRVNSGQVSKFSFKINDAIQVVSVSSNGSELRAKNTNGDVFSILKNNIKTYDCEIENMFCFHDDSKFNGAYIDIIINDNSTSLFIDGEHYIFEKPNHFGKETGTVHNDEIVANLPGKIVAINNKLGDKVKKGQVIVVLEAMKMEHSLSAQMDGEIIEMSASLNAQTKLGDLLVKLG
jgi:3-methylcrotonyl-CoA carboxylase alpha subunit